VCNFSLSSTSQGNDEKAKPINFSEVANNLTQKEQGVWFSGSTAACSYPADGQDRYFAIEDNSFWFRHRNNAIIAAVKKFPPAGFILDVGGANGYVTLGLRKNGFNAVLLEPSITGLRNARKRGLYPIICSTVADAGFKNNTIPAVGLFDVLEHIEDEAGFLKELKRILFPDGRLYLTVPACQMLWAREDEYAGHFRRYSISRIKKLLKNNKFKVDYATYLFSYLPVPLFFVRTLPTKLGLAKPSTDENARRENVVKPKITNVILSLYHKLELLMIKQNIPIPIGSSLLVVAHPEA
jgi:SAM-dependent methyltransferase